MSAAPTDSYRSFPVTNWSLVAAAGKSDTDTRGKALDALLRQYLPALKAYAIAKFGVDPAAVDDWLQDFVLHKVITDKMFERVRKERGRFRVFLMTAFSNFVLSELRKAKAQKRQPSHASLPLYHLAEK